MTPMSWNNQFEINRCCQVTLDYCVWVRNKTKQIIQKTNTSRICANVVTFYFCSTTSSSCIYIFVVCTCFKFSLKSTLNEYCASWGRAPLGTWQTTLSCRALPSMDEHVGEEAPGLLPAFRLVRERAVPDAVLQSDPLLLGLPHSIVNKHGQLVGDTGRGRKSSNESFMMFYHVLFFLFLCRKYQSKSALGCAADGGKKITNGWENKNE